MKEIAIFNGTQHASEAIDFMHRLEDKNTVLAKVYLGHGIPLTPLAYFIFDKTLLISIAEDLGYTIIEKEQDEE